MSYRSDIIVEITEEERDEIIAAMSKAMGGFIKKQKTTDMKAWSKDDWMNFVNVAFNECAPKVIMKRISVSKPYWATDTEDDLNDKIPF